MMLVLLVLEVSLVVLRLLRLIEHGSRPRYEDDVGALALLMQESTGTV